MQSDKLSPLLQYSPAWLVIGLLLIVALVSWYVLVMWLTRKKKPHTIATLKPVDPVLPDIPALQKKYLALIDEIEQAYNSGQIKSRHTHQKLSLLLRFFAFECRGLRTHVFTLSDLRQVNLPKLTHAIERYYVPAFHDVEHGDPVAASTVAREVVTTWS